MAEEFLYYPDSDPRFQTLVTDDGSYSSPQRPDETLETLRQRHEAQLQVFKTSKTYQQILEIASTIFSKPRAFKISSYICLGLGSISGPNGLNDADGIMAQLIFLEAWIAILREHFPIPDIYFQDPIFNTPDRAFLTSRGWAVVDSPASVSLQTEESLVFGPYLPMVPKWHVFKTCMPAMWVGHPMDRNLDGTKGWVELVEPFVRRSVMVEPLLIMACEEGRAQFMSLWYPK